MLEVKEGAIFVADAHYATYRPQFKKLIDKIVSGEIKTPQLFLMGDIFDLLMGPIKAFTQAEEPIVKQLQELSKSMEIIYFEGNHDFQLKQIFPDMQIYPLSAQPLAVTYKGSQGYLAHGDWNEGSLYRLYSWLIRNRIVLYGLAFLDRLLLYKISKLFREKMRAKQLCSEFKNFENYIHQKFRRATPYKGWFIEGHYHQGSTFFVGEIFYQNLAAMACNKSYFVVQSKEDVISLVSCTL
jgi:UDP-2,3-diacylglucosamine hydrolase